MPVHFHIKPAVFVLTLMLMVFASSIQAQHDDLYRIENSTVHFKSEAPLELIEASTREMSGLLDPSDGSYALSIPVRSFLGFNSPLQMEHFNANYMETHKYKTATFLGRIIEDLDFSKDGIHDVRAKGTLTIHNVAQDRIIPCKLVIRGNEISVTSNFTVLLRDHNISIPKIVEQKIASEIRVDIEATFTIEKAN